MASLTFQRYNQTAFYSPQNGNTYFGYLLLGVSSPPPSLTIADSWAQSGVYIFFPSLPSDLDTFITNATTYLTAIGRQGTRFVWFSDTHNLTGTILQLQGAQVGQTTFIPLGSNIALRVNGQNTIALNDDGTGLTFTPATGQDNALRVTPPPMTDLAHFSTLQYAAPQTLTITDLSLLFEADSRADGRFNFGMSIDGTAIDFLDIGLRYFTINPQLPGYVQSMRHPLFALDHNERWQLQGVIDPLNALDQQRTFLSFGGSTPRITSYFTNTLGDALTITPTASAGFVFATRIQTSSTQPAVQQPFYLTPGGEFAVQNTLQNSAQPLSSNVMCGFSGVEYIQLEQSVSYKLHFIPNQPAYADAQVAQDAHGNIVYTFKPLSNVATTSWCYISADQRTANYYAQPDSAVVYQIPPDNSNPDYLSYLALQSGSLPAPSAVGTGLNAPLLAFPMVPYRGIATTSLPLYQQFGIQVLAPTRRAQIDTIDSWAGAHGLKPAALDETATIQGSTPQGMLTTLSGNDWQTLLLAQTPIKSGELAQGEEVFYQNTPLQLADVAGGLKAALQSNQLFLVISSRDALFKNASIAYKISSEILQQLLAANVPQDIITNLQKLRVIDSKTSKFYYPIYNDLATCTAQLQSVLTTDQFNAYGSQIITAIAFFSIIIAEWQFDLSPYQWDSYKTILIFKFFDKSMEELVGNTDVWMQGNVFNADIKATQQQLQTIIRDARSAVATETNFKNFVDLVGNQQWNGILALNVRTPLDGLPEALEGIAAGIDVSKFFAHHVGINISPVQRTGSTLSVRDSSVFGLIHYQDPTNLDSKTADYQFKVLSLQVLFDNSAIVNFASKIELLVNRLFSEAAQLTNSMVGNNLVLNGVYQKNGEMGSYVFLNDADNLFFMTSAVLAQVEVARTQFVTVVPQAGLQAGQNVQTQFILEGRIKFQALGGFDLFSFGNSPGIGGLNFANLLVRMSFNPATPTYSTFAFDAQHITLNPSISVARPASLYNHFPLKLTGLIQATGSTTPPTLGYMPVDSPLRGSEIQAPWYGLAFDLNLGTLGALASKAGFTANLLAGWAPSPDNYQIYIGLKLPDSTGGKREISLQGILKLTFGDIRFLVDGDAYLLQLRKIALSLFTLSFPPGQIDLLIFGNPNEADNTTLGWYAAYAKPNSGNSKQPKQLPGGPNRPDNDPSSGSR